MATREWIRLDVGLLDDEGWMALSDAAKGVWITAYLASAPLGGVFKSEAYLLTLLRKEGVADPAEMVEQMSHMLVFHDDGSVSIRGFDTYQGKWRGPSDDPAYKAAKEAERRAARAAVGARGSDVGARGSDVGARGTQRARLRAAAEDKRGQENPQTPTAVTTTDDLGSSSSPGMAQVKAVLQEKGLLPRTKS